MTSCLTIPIDSSRTKSRDSPVSLNKRLDNKTSKALYFFAVAEFPFLRFKITSTNLDHCAWLISVKLDTGHVFGTISLVLATSFWNNLNLRLGEKKTQIHWVDSTPLCKLWESFLIWNAITQNKRLTVNHRALYCMESYMRRHTFKCNGSKRSLQICGKI